MATATKEERAWFDRYPEPQEIAALTQQVPWPASEPECIKLIGFNPICKQLGGFKQIQANLQKLARRYRETLQTQVGAYEVLSQRMNETAGQLEEARAATAALGERLREQEQAGQRASTRQEGELAAARNREMALQGMLAQQVTSFVEADALYNEQLEQLERDIADVQQRVQSRGEPPGKRKEVPGGKAQPSKAVGLTEPEQEELERAKPKLQSLLNIPVEQEDEIRRRVQARNFTKKEANLLFRAASVNESREQKELLPAERIIAALTSVRGYRREALEALFR